MEAPGRTGGRTGPRRVSDQRKLRALPEVGPALDAEVPGVGGGVKQERRAL